MVKGQQISASVSVCPSATYHGGQLSAKSGQSADEIWLVPTHDVVCDFTPIQCIKWFAGMEASTLTFQELFRPGSASNGYTVAERCSSDFLINERSLLNAIVMAAGGHSDFMGCFVKGFLEQNKQSNSRLLLREPAETESGRILLSSAPSAVTSGVAPTQYLFAKTMTVSRGSPLLTRTAMKSLKSLKESAPSHLRSMPMRQLSTMWLRSRR